MSLPIQEPPALFIPKRSGDTIVINITFPSAPVNITGKAVLCQVGIQQASRRRRRRQNGWSFLIISPSSPPCLSRRWKQSPPDGYGYKKKPVPLPGQEKMQPAEAGGM